MSAKIPSWWGRARLALAAGVWLCLVVGALGGLAYYTAQPGQQRMAPAGWPEGTAVGRTAEGAEMVLFLHPKCPCSRATVRQLERALVYARGGLAIRVVVFAPPGEDTGWRDTSIVKAAAALPGAEVVLDVDGAEARRFGAYTSGQVLLYDAGGRLVFSGGVTPGRGHEGDCAGLEALSAWLAGRGSSAGGAPVYGCAIVEEMGVEGGQACRRKP